MEKNKHSVFPVRNHSQLNMAQFSLSNVHKRGLKHPSFYFLTVEHIMVHCADYIRDNYYTVNNIHELINNVDPKDILGFLREAGLRNKI